MSRVWEIFSFIHNHAAGFRHAGYFSYVQVYAIGIAIIRTIRYNCMHAQVFLSPQSSDNAWFFCHILSKHNSARPQYRHESQIL